MLSSILGIGWMFPDKVHDGLICSYVQVAHHAAQTAAAPYGAARLSLMGWRMTLDKQTTLPTTVSPQGHRIFLSFARGDHKLAGLLFKLLVELTGDPSLVFKSDNAVSGIMPGSDWRKSLLAELQTAKVLVGLVTPRSIAGRWLWIEGGIVWSREPSLVRLFATTDIAATQMVPFDHIQACFLDKTLRAQVKKAIEDAVGLVGTSPVWSNYANRLLGDLLSAAAASVQASSTSTSNFPSSGAERDERTLRELLVNVPTTVMDRFLEELRKQYILEDIFYYYEGFRGTVLGSDFHVFDPELRQRIERFAKAWNSSLSFSNYVIDLPGGSKFRLPAAHELGSYEQWNGLLSRFDDAATDLMQAYTEFVSYVKATFPAIDLKETTRAAIKQKEAYYSDLSEIEATPLES